MLNRLLLTSFVAMQPRSLHTLPMAGTSVPSFCTYQSSHLHVRQLSSLSSSTSTSSTPNVVVCFGRPGAGKTTVANKALDTLLSQSSSSPSIRCVGLDLDVCVPQWMKDNFANGIYPTLQQRQTFATEACDYVDEQLAAQLTTTSSMVTTQSPTPIVALVSFSFVNTDLRDTFRSRFPQAEWVLIHTDIEEAQRRIQQREGHFYKGNTSGAKDDVPSSAAAAAAAEDDENNSEWDFAPVTFPHRVLDGDDCVEHNSDQIVEIIRSIAEKRNV